MNEILMLLASTFTFTENLNKAIEKYQAVIKPGMLTNPSGIPNPPPPPPMVGAIGLGKQVKPFESLQAIVQGKPLAETKKELEPNKPAKKSELTKLVPVDDFKNELEKSLATFSIESNRIVKAQIKVLFARILDKAKKDETFNSLYDEYRAKFNKIEPDLIDARATY